MDFGNVFISSVLNPSVEDLKKNAMLFGFLSKLTHPTAGLVVGLMHQSDVIRTLQSTCITRGIYFADQCVIALTAIVSAISVSAEEIS
jgi:hypothetical protein